MKPLSQSTIVTLTDTVAHELKKHPEGQQVSVSMVSSGCNCAGQKAGVELGNGLQAIASPFIAVKALTDLKIGQMVMMGSGGVTPATVPSKTVGVATSSVAEGQTVTVLCAGIVVHNGATGYDSWSFAAGQPVYRTSTGMPTYKPSSDEQPVGVALSSNTLLFQGLTNGAS